MAPLQGQPAELLTNVSAEETIQALSLRIAHAHMRRLLHLHASDSRKKTQENVTILGQTHQFCVQIAQQIQVKIQHPCYVL